MIGFDGDPTNTSADRTTCFPKVIDKTSLAEILSGIRGVLCDKIADFKHNLTQNRGCKS
jgi:hypothetical protein